MFFDIIQSLLLWFLIGIFILFYPMFISIYVFLPLLIGIMGYVFMVGMAKGKGHYILVSLLYFINLEVNLSLPLFLMLLATLLIYVLFYTKLSKFKRCRVCARIFMVILIDLMYLGLLLGYDFIFQSTSVMLDVILAYSLVIDILIVMVL